MACAAISTFANVNVSLMIPRQPDVPNFMTDMARIIAVAAAASTAMQRQPCGIPGILLSSFLLRIR
jgi:hypothetical protein